MSTTTAFILDGIKINNPKEAVPKVGEDGIIIEASFGTDEVQPQITPLEFTFTNEAAKRLRQIVADGDIFRGIDLQADIVGRAGTINAVNGFLDLADKYVEISPVQVVSEVKFKESTLTLDEQIASVTLDLMRLLGVIKTTDEVDVEYVVEKPVDLIETAILSITLYLMIKELAESVEKISSDIANVLGLTSTSITGGVGAVVYQVAIIVVRTAYAALMLKTIIDLMTDILNSFISPVRTHKGLTYRTVLEKTFNYLGYNFVSPITDLDFLTYLPSSPSRGGSITSAIPRVNDYGYNFSEFVKLAADPFDAKIAVIDGDLHFRKDSDPFWEKNSTFVMEDVILEDVNSKKFNPKELVKSRILRYKTDDSDWWTVDNYKGTEFAVITQHDPPLEDLKQSGLKGFEWMDFPIALGNRKDGLNNVEELLKVLAQAADVVTGVFGIKQNFAQKVEKRVGMLKVSHEIHSVSKVLYLVGGVMPEDHRDKLSCRTLWNDSISYTSFIANDFKRQREVYEDVEIGFGLDNFIETSINSYFTTSSGRRGKFVNVRWAVELDRAIVDFWIEEVYTRKLKEVYIEQE